MAITIANIAVPPEARVQAKALAGLLDLTMGQATAFALNDTLARVIAAGPAVLRVDGPSAAAGSDPSGGQANGSDNANVAGKAA